MPYPNPFPKSVGANHNFTKPKQLKVKQRITLKIENKGMGWMGYDGHETDLSESIKNISESVQTKIGHFDGLTDERTYHSGGVAVLQKCIKLVRIRFQ